MTEYGSDLSHFEEESAKTPVKQPYAIIGGAVLLLIVAFLISWLAPTEGVKDLKKAAESSGAAAATAVSSDGEDEL